MSHCGLSPQNFLLLIENSPAVATFWPELRDCYLPTLVEQLSGSHPTHLRNIFVSGSRPALHEFPGSVHKQCSNVEDGLNELQFNYEPDNRLSVAQIQGSIEFLSSTPTTDIRHLIVVAATTPVEFGFGHPSFDPWNELAKLLTKEEVYFHLALTSSLRSGPLPKLFEHTLKRQQHTEEPLWLPKYSTAFIFRVAAPETYPDGAQPNSEPKGKESICAARAQRDTIPSDIYTTKAIDEISSESPSLVSQLQQHHGLTKKKVYGTKPPRVPFIMDEPVRERHRKPASSKQSSTSTRVASEIGAPPLLTRSSRSRSNLRGDRAFSTSRPQRTTDPYAVRPPLWTPRGPENDSPGHSSYSPSSPPSSPVVQMPAAERYPGDSYAVDLTVSPEVSNLPWASKENACASFYPAFSCSRAGYIPGGAPFPDSEAARVQDASLLPAFQSIPTPCDIMATAPPSNDFVCTLSEVDFRTSLYQQCRVDDDHGSLSFPPVSPPAQRHIHAPTPSMVIPAGNLLAAPTPRRVLPPMPSVSGPTPDRARASVRAASQSMQPRNANPHAVYASAPARSGRSRDDFASSSSLTGWAG